MRCQKASLARVVSVPAEILRCGMHHHVGAERQRLTQQRRGERGVDGEPRPRLTGEGGDGREVGDREARIGGRLGPDQRGLAGADGRGDAFRAGLVDALDLQAPVLGPAEEPVLERPVELFRHDHVIAGLQRLEDGGGGGHPGTEHGGGRAPLETIEHGLDQLVARIVGPRVESAGEELIIRPPLVRGRGLDRRHERPRGGLAETEGLREIGGGAVWVQRVHRRSVCFGGAGTKDRAGLDAGCRGAEGRRAWRGRSGAAARRRAEAVLQRVRPDRPRGRRWRGGDVRRACSGP
jgi:hypothetical protein